MNVQFPTERHKAAVEKMLDMYRTDSVVHGALLCGSLARGTARPDSDIDILVVLEEDPDEHTRRSQCGALDVEETRRTYEGWVDQFNPWRIGDESWGYAFLDGLPLYDPHGLIDQLVAAARESHRTYQTPEQVRSYYRWLWDHVKPKMESVLRSGIVRQCANATHPVLPASLRSPRSSSCYPPSLSYRRVASLPANCRCSTRSCLRRGHAQANRLSMRRVIVA